MTNSGKVAKRIPVAQAKARFSAIVAEVAYAGEHFIIERRGKAMAALVGVRELEQIEEAHAASKRMLGALAMAGAWRGIEDQALDKVIAAIYAQRLEDTGRPVLLED